MKIKNFGYLQIIIFIFCSTLIISNLIYVGNYNRNKINEDANYDNSFSHNLKASANPGSFMLSSDNYQLYTGNTFNLSWTTSDGAKNYSIYVSNKQITTPNEATLVKDNITDLFYLTSNNNLGLHYYVAIAYNDSGYTLSNNIEITILAYPSPSEDDDDKEEASHQFEIPIIFLILIALLFLITIILFAGYTMNHYFKHKTTLKKPKITQKDQGLVLDKSSLIPAKNIIDKLVQNQELFRSIDENHFEDNKHLLKNLTLTSLSSKFLNKIDKIGWIEEKEKKQFIIEMLALTPKEREDIIDYMIKKSRNNETS